MSIKQPTPSLPDAVDRGIWSVVLEARRAGTPWQELRTHHGMPALIRAIIDDEGLVVRHMLHAEAPVGRCFLRDGSWLSPLWAAIERQRLGIVELLLQAGADPNLGPHSENTASENGTPGFEHQSQDQKNKSRQSPLMFSCANYSTEAAEIGQRLLQQGAIPEPAFLTQWMRAIATHSDTATVVGFMKAAQSFVEAGGRLPEAWPEWLMAIRENPAWGGEGFHEQCRVLQQITDRHFMERSIAIPEDAGNHIRL